MSNSARIIPASEGWSRWLDKAAHDIYQTAAYHRLAEKPGESEAFLAIYERGAQLLAWPYLLRSLPQGQESGGDPWKDATSVYGYSGPVACSVSPNDSFLGEAAEAIVAAWQSQRIVSIFTRFHPLLENHVWAEPVLKILHQLGPAAEGHVVPQGLTVSVDLEDPVRDYGQMTRRGVKKGRQAGLMTEYDQSWTHFDDYLRIYYDAMERNQAAKSYFYPARYFEELRQSLGPHVPLLITRLKDKVAAAMIFLEYHGIVQAHLGGAASEFLHLSPYRVLLDDVQSWALPRGNKVLHLGGGRGSTSDSLFQFKAGFSNRRHHFYSGRLILDRSAYDLLCRTRSEGLPVSISQLSVGDFFPAYRAPIPEMLQDN